MFWKRLYIPRVKSTTLLHTSRHALFRYFIFSVALNSSSKILFSFNLCNVTHNFWRYWEVECPFNFVSLVYKICGTVFPDCLFTFSWPILGLVSVRLIIIFSFFCIILISIKIRVLAWGKCRNYRDIDSCFSGCWKCAVQI